MHQLNDFIDASVRAYRTTLRERTLNVTRDAIRRLHDDLATRHAETASHAIGLLQKALDNPVFDEKTLERLIEMLQNAQYDLHIEPQILDQANHFVEVNACLYGGFDVVHAEVTRAAITETSDDFPTLDAYETWLEAREKTARAERMTQLLTDALTTLSDRLEKTKHEDDAHLMQLLRDEDLDKHMREATGRRVTRNDFDAIRERALDEGFLLAPNISSYSGRDNLILVVKRQLSNVFAHEEEVEEHA